MTETSLNHAEISELAKFLEFLDSLKFLETGAIIIKDSMGTQAGTIKFDCFSDGYDFHYGYPDIFLDDLDEEKLVTTDDQA